MQRYRDYSPTCFDSAGAFLPDRQDWLVAPCARTRDSGPLDESNFRVALTILGGESDTVEVHRFGHWGPGWFEIIIVDPARESEVADIESQLEDYPLLDEMDFGELEHEAQAEAVNNWALSDFTRALGVEDYYPRADSVLFDSDGYRELFDLALERHPYGFEPEADGSPRIDCGRLAGLITPADIAATVRKYRRAG